MSSLLRLMLIFPLIFITSCEKKFQRPDLSACKASNTESCSEWASLEYLDGNVKKAKEFLNMACENNDAISCYDLAMMLADEGLELSANKLIIKACELKNEEACEYVDDMNLLPGRTKGPIKDFEIPTQKSEEENPDYLKIREEDKKAKLEGKQTQEASEEA